MSDKSYLMLLDAEGEGIAAYEIKQDLGFLPDPDGSQDGRRLFTVVPKNKKSAMESYVVTRQHRESGQLYIIELDGTHTIIKITSKLPTEIGDDPNCECTLCFIKREIARRRQESEERELKDIGELASDIKSKLVQVFAAELIRDLLAGKTDNPELQRTQHPEALQITGGCMRFIDEIKQITRFGTPSWIPHDADSLADWDEFTRDYYKRICKPDLTVIEVSNVADYYFHGVDQEHWKATDFPNVAPPFPICWFEYRLPSSIRSSEHGEKKLGPVSTRPRIGVYVEYEPREEGGWNILMVPYTEIMQVHPLTVKGPYGEWRAAISKEGVLAEKFVVEQIGTDTKFATEMLDEMTALTHPIFLAISFMHCKNVTLSTERVDKKLARRYQERHGVQPVKFHTLVIEPLKQILKKEGKSEQTGLHKAMHICRGHFRDYREGKGLFGKHNVLVWQDSIVRGTIEKDIPRREIEIKL